MKMKLSHILVSHQHEAEDLLRHLSESQDFAELAKKHSQCPSRVRGGSLGDIDLGRLDADFAEAAKKLEEGQTSGVVRTRFGYHLILRH